MKRASHHWHVLLEPATGAPSPAVLEHEHQVNPGRRHAHYWTPAEVFKAAKESGMSDADARVAELRYGDTASSTLSLEAPPTPAMDEPGVVRELHPEVRRSLS